MNREHVISLKKGKSTIERNESTGRDTVFMSKMGPAAFINGPISEMNKTNPNSMQAISHQINVNNNRKRFQQNFSELQKQESVEVTCIDHTNMGILPRNHHNVDSRNQLQSQPPLLTSPINLGKPQSQFDLVMNNKNVPYHHH